MFKELEELENGKIIDFKMTPYKDFDFFEMEITFLNSENEETILKFDKIKISPTLILEEEVICSDSIEILPLTRNLSLSFEVDTSSKRKGYTVIRPKKVLTKESIRRKLGYDYDLLPFKGMAIFYISELFENYGIELHDEKGRLRPTKEIYSEVIRKSAELSKEEREELIDILEKSVDI